MLSTPIPLLISFLKQQREALLNFLMIHKTHWTSIALWCIKHIEPQRINYSCKFLIIKLAKVFACEGILIQTDVTTKNELLYMLWHGCEMVTDDGNNMQNKKTYFLKYFNVFWYCSWIQTNFILPVCMLSMTRFLNIQ